MSNNSPLPIIAVGALGLSSISCGISSLTGFLVSDDSNVESNTSTSNTNTDTSNTSTSNTSTSNTSTEQDYAIPHQISLGTDDGWCIGTDSVHQDVPGCGRICSSPYKVGSKTDDTWGPWEDTTIPCTGAKLDEIWEKQDDGTRKLADGYIASKFKDGISVQCTTNDLRGREGSVYRVNSDGVLNWYPNPSIAETWNPDWNANITQIADCVGLTKGENLGYAPGTSVQCTTNDLRGREGSVYRVNSDGILDYYQSPSIAETWNPDWNVNITQIPDCAGLTKGEDLEMKT